MIFFTNLQINYHISITMRIYNGIFHKFRHKLIFITTFYNQLSNRLWKLTVKITTFSFIEKKNSRHNDSLTKEKSCYLRSTSATHYALVTFSSSSSILHHRSTHVHFFFVQQLIHVHLVIDNANILSLPNSSGQESLHWWFITYSHACWSTNVL